MSVKGYVIRVEEEEIFPEEKEKERVERLPLGIEKLDEALEGGIPIGSWVVVSGEPGTGKTVLTQHAALSALRSGYKVVVVSTEMKRWEWLAQARELGLAVDEYPMVRLKDVYYYSSSKKSYLLQVSKVPEKLGLVFVDIHSLAHVARMMGKRDKAERGEGKWYWFLGLPVLTEAMDLSLRLFAEKPDERYYTIPGNVLLIIDSISVFYERSPSTARSTLLRLGLRYKWNNIVALLTSHYAITTGTTFGFGIEHVADGVIHMWMESVEKAKEVRRYLIVKKMRMTNHSTRAFRVEIVKHQGMRVEPV